METAGWRAFYANGRIYDSRRDDWRTLLAKDVLFVIRYRDEFAVPSVRYRKVFDRDDYYWQDPEIDTIHSSMTEPDVPTQYVKRDTEIPVTAFYTLKTRALNVTWN